jgi:hypothetical protein
MTTIPSHCHSCGAIFASRFISIEGSVKNLTLSNNSETCPNCGGRAFLANGVFDIANDVISIISAPSFTKEMLSKLGVAVAEAYKDPSKTEQLNSIAEGIDPELAKVVKKITSGNKLTMVGLFLLAMAIKSCSVNIDLDVNKLIDQLKAQPPQATEIETFSV